MQTADTISDILAYLQDGNWHTYQEIAKEVGVSKRTVQRHVESLSYRHPIDFSRGYKEEGKRGIRLDITQDTALGAIPDYAKDLIIKSLKAYKDQVAPSEVRTYMWLLDKFSNSKQIND